ncbi:hypothetical protein F7725_020862 [Dissostichus mawsoni]|uniref:CUB domain-containing protein n=1 Tax=Dissostichus mawsoni TaxID=36200 RepID=A0A7J5YEE6_DISMA|nr:hypothetical protein F7725_020862 [Dissostichus mawsoni]
MTEAKRKKWRDGIGPVEELRVCSEEVEERAKASSSPPRDSNRLTTDFYRKEENITVTPVRGAIYSPRYPNAYPRNLLLSWKLLSPPGSRIHLEFDGHFGLEEAENGVCRYDFVEVEDQSETSTIIWGRWCGQKAPPSLNSKTNVLRVTFKSDDYFVAKPGFKVFYSLLTFSLLPSRLPSLPSSAFVIPPLTCGTDKREEEKRQPEERRKSEAERE